ncbi:hypothetical protein JHW43_007711 [Diplocarpon mali]|nr:hypothetical protein JHW43_007711 [Diplocarpon mali]
MDFAANPKGPVKVLQTDPIEDLDTHQNKSTESVSYNENRMDEKVRMISYQEQVRALETQMKAVKKMILEGSGDVGDFHDEKFAPLSKISLSMQVYEQCNLAEVASERDANLTRTRTLEGRSKELLSFVQKGKSAEAQEMVDQMNILTGERDRPYDDIHGGVGYLSQIQSLSMLVESEAAEPEVIIRLNAALTDAQAAMADRDSSLYDVDELNDRVDAMADRLQVVNERNFLLAQKTMSEAKIGAFSDRNFEIVAPENYGDAAMRRGIRKIRDVERLGDKELTQPQSRTKSSIADKCEEHLFCAGLEGDSVIRQNEEARRNLTTRTAERNGAHQRIKILEEQATDHREREISLRKELHKEKEKRVETRPRQPNPKITDCDAERKEIVLLKKERNRVTIEAANLQYERDAARAEVKSLKDENVTLRTAAEAAKELAKGFQRSLDAANNAALAESDRAEEARRTQNRLRVKRETVRMEANKLRIESAAAHQVSSGLSMNGMFSGEDSVHTREEKDAAVINNAELHDALIEANKKAETLQKRLNDCLGKYAEEPTDSESLGKVNNIVAERDAALARGRLLEHLLEDLEEDYRKNLDQWEQQTKSDEREINTSKVRLNDCRARVNDLSAKLNSATKRIEVTESQAQGAEVRARAANQRADSAEDRFAALEIQFLRTKSDLDAVKNLTSKHEGVRNQLRVQCVLFAALATAARAEAIRVGGNTIKSAHSSSTDAPATLISSSQGSDASLYSAHGNRDSESPFPCPMQQSLRQGPPPPIQTSPTMSTIRSPRATRNKDPDYRGKRKPKPSSDKDRTGKRRRKDDKKFD